MELKDIYTEEQYVVALEEILGVICSYSKNMPYATHFEVSKDNPDKVLIGEKIAVEQASNVVKEYILELLSRKSL